MFSDLQLHQSNQFKGQQQSKRSNFVISAKLINVFFEEQKYWGLIMTENNIKIRVFDVWCTHVILSSLSRDWSQLQSRFWCGIFSSPYFALVSVCLEHKYHLWTGLVTNKPQETTKPQTTGKTSIGWTVVQQQYTTQLTMHNDSRTGNRVKYSHLPHTIFLLGSSFNNSVTLLALLNRSYKKQGQSSIRKHLQAGTIQQQFRKSSIQSPVTILV